MIFSKTFLLWLLVLLYGFVQNRYFGGNPFPESDTEVLADGILCILTAFALMSGKGRKMTDEEFNREVRRRLDAFVGTDTEREKLRGLFKDEDLGVTSVTTQECQDIVRRAEERAKADNE